MPNRKAFDMSAKGLDEICFRTYLAPAMVHYLQHVRGGCTPKCFNPDLPSRKQRVVGDVVAQRTRVSAYILSSLHPPGGSERQCVLEVVRHVLIRFGRKAGFVSLDPEWPAHLDNIVQVNFRGPRKSPPELEAGPRLIIEIALLSLRGRHVRPLLDELLEVRRKEST